MIFYKFDRDIRSKLSELGLNKTNIHNIMNNKYLLKT